MKSHAEKHNTAEIKANCGCGKIGEQENSWVVCHTCQVN